jgi:H+/Cl- antiporter ClcA
MKKIFNQHWLLLAGVIVGALGGYLYWYFIGCNNGTCPLTSSPVNSSIAGALLGGLVFTSFPNSKKNENKDKE